MASMTVTLNDAGEALAGEAGTVLDSMRACYGPGEYPATFTANDGAVWFGSVVIVASIGAARFAHFAPIAQRISQEG